MPENHQQEILKLHTPRFGAIEVPATQVITMPLGLVGFPRLNRYIIMEHRPGSPFHWLQSLDQPELAFVITDPLVFDPGYQLVLSGSDTKLLEVGDPRDLQVWVLVTIPAGNPEGMTANFKAPVVLNLRNRVAAQVILDDARWSLRQPLKK